MRKFALILLATQSHAESLPGAARFASNDSHSFRRDSNGYQPRSRLEGRQQFPRVRGAGRVPSELGFVALWNVTRTVRAAAHRRHGAGAHQTASGSVSSG